MQKIEIGVNKGDWKHFVSASSRLVVSRCSLGLALDAPGPRSYREHELRLELGSYIPSRVPCGGWFQLKDSTRSQGTFR